MMAISHRFFADIDLLGTVLLHFLWQGALVAALYYPLRRACGSAVSRYRLAMSALIALALFPLITFVYLQPIAGAAGAAHPRSSMLLGTFGTAADHAISSWHARALLPWLVAGWFCGVLLLAMRSLRQWACLQLMVRTADPLPANWTLRLARISNRFALRRPVRLLSSVVIPTPMLIGWIKPTILLPASMISGLAPDQLELVIAHELGHVCRWDYLMNLMQVVIETVLFYHPVVHWISRDARNAREECCDDLVLNVARGDPLVYARTLADLEEMRQGMAAATPALAVSGGELLARVRRIVGVGEAIEPLSRSYGWPLIMLLAALVLVAWRSHPLPVDMPTALANLPARTMAVVSGNPKLSVKVPSIAAQPLKLAPTNSPGQGRGMAAIPRPSVPVVADPANGRDAREAIRIARPGVHLVGAPSVTPMRDLVTSIPLVEPMPSGALAAPSESTKSSVVLPLYVEAAQYPQQAMVRGIEGSVELQFRVDGTGNVRNIQVLESRPAGVFEAAARRALEQWRFPASAAASEPYTQKFSFNLKAKNSTGGPTYCQHITGTLICRHAGN